MWRIRSSRITGAIGLLILCVILMSISCDREPQEIRIGVIATMAVDLMHKSMLNSIEMVRSDLEKEGGLMVGNKRHSVTFVIERIDGGVPEQAVAATNRLINQKSVVAIVGPDFSIDAIPAGEVAEKARIPLISSLSTHPRTTEGKKYVFRISFLNSMQAISAARYCVYDLEAKRSAVLYNLANPYSRSLAETFRDTVLAEGGLISDFESYTTGKADYSSQLERIKRSDPEILYLPNFFQETEPIVIKARDMGIRATLMGVESWNRQRFKNLPQFDGSYMTANWAPDIPSEESRAFSEEYISRFDILPEDGAALTFDGVQVLMEAIKSQGKTDGESIREGLYALGPFKGVTGTIDFVHSGDLERWVTVLKIEDGKVRYKKRILPSKTGLR